MAADTSTPTTSTQPLPLKPVSGGTVEPANRAAVAKDTFQTPRDPQGERFELRDPFAEVTYRARTLEDMAAKAAQLGATRFTAIAEDGRRTPIVKVGKGWQREEPLPARPERPLDLGPVQGDHSDRPDAAAKAKQAPDIAPKPERLDVKTLTTIDAEAERTALVARLKTELKDRYIIKNALVTVGDVPVGRTEYRFRGDSSRVAFTESTFRLATDTNSPSVARSMVDVAQTRNWKGLRVSGSEDFRRLVWLEASVRGVKAIGYEPNPADLEVLRREQQARQNNRIEPTKEPPAATTAAKTEKSSARGSGGRKAVVAAIEAVLVAKRVPEAQRTAVLAAATEQLAQRTRQGQAYQVKVYDKAAPPQRAPAMATPEPSRSQERAVAAPAR